MNIGELIESTIARAGRTIYGEPVSAAGKTVIPVAKIAYGFGMGKRPAKEGSPDTPSGGGGGLRGNPVGFIEITETATRYVPIVDYQEIAIAAAVAFAAGFFLGRLANGD